MRLKRLTTSLLTVAIVVAICFVGSACHARGDVTPRQQVQSSLAALDAWLGNNVNGEAWRCYLRLEMLRGELSSGSKVRPDTLRAVLQRFQSGAKGLRLPRFVAVRDAVSRWIEQLPAGGDDTEESDAEEKKEEDEEDIARRVQDAKSGFRDLGEDDVRQSRRRLRRSVDRLNRFLSRGGPRGRAWKQFLRLPDLRAQTEPSTEPNLRALLDIAAKYQTRYPGLDLPEFSQVGRATRGYLEALWAARSRNARGQYELQMDRLAQALAASIKEPTTDHWQTVGGLLGWFDDRGQARGLLRLIRRRYNRPNLRLLVSGILISDGLQQRVDDEQPVTDFILGTCISGTGHTTGRVRFDLVPNSRHAELDALFLGAARTRTIGRNRSARIGTVGTTRVRARKRLVIDSEGLRSLPTRSRAQTSTHLTGIWSTQPRLRGRLVTRIASRRAAQSKAEGESIAARHAERRFNKNLDSRIGDVLREGNHAFWQHVREPLLRRGDFPQRLHLSTTKTLLSVEAMYAASHQLAAQSSPPRLVGDPEMAVRVHESFLDNYLASLLGGVHLDQQRVRQRLINTFGKLPEKFKQAREPWSITFARKKPVTVRFDHGGFVVVMRATEFSSGDRRVAPMNITAKYGLQRTDAGLKAVRREELAVLPPDIYDAIQSHKRARRMSVREQTGAALLRRRLSSIFEDELVLEHLVLPGRLEQLGELQPTQLDAEKGWLALGWRRVSKSSVATQHPHNETDLTNRAAVKPDAEAVAKRSDG